ncbi:type II CAAX endopeptidase family protein [Zhihengliuella sp.]|uniref:CPBP family intramembrane glutamic endopeptidase n=1 Tax=Zhihengliuella sp. TaxID=1954483 RepID=UPI0028113D1E|nr:type II CAAX endopeptidase family protein [Zhihengliuella sp.]
MSLPHQPHVATPRPGSTTLRSESTTLRAGARSLPAAPAARTTGASTIGSAGPLPPWAAGFAASFAIVQLVVAVAVCLPVFAGLARSGYLVALTPFLMWVPALGVIGLHAVLRPPVRLLDWCGLRVGSRASRRRAAAGPDGRRRPASLPGVLGWSFALLVLLSTVAAATIGAAVAVGAVDWDPAPGATSAAAWVLPLVLLGMLATAGEEIAWRGYLASTLAPWGSVRSSAAIGAFWALWHLPLTAAYAMDGVVGWREVAATTVNLFLSALVLAAARYASRSVWPAIAGHAMLNTVLVFAYSNLITPTRTLDDAAYWTFQLVAWGVLLAAAALGAVVAARRRPSAPAITRGWIQPG